MADQKVSDLPSLNGADVDPADLLYIIDSSAGSAGSKKITVGQYQLAPVSGGTANGVVYLNGSKVVTTGSALVFDGSNLGIGTASPAAKLQVVGGQVLLDNGQFYGIKTSGGVNNAVLNLDASNNLIIGAGGATVTAQLWTGGSERARITSGGDLLVGTTGISSYRFEVTSSGNTGLFQTTSGTSWPCISWSTATTGDNLFYGFFTEGTATERGRIDYNRAGGLTRYNTTSDYRAKDIIGPVQNPGATIDALKVYEGKMKGATQSRPMLIAHEAQQHAPYAVSGVKDEVNKDGTPKFQQMDVSSLVPLLLAEIQSLRARVAALESA